MSTIVTNNNANDENIRYHKNTRLRFLDKLDDYKVHHDDVDPRGYTVKLSTGEKIGEVEGLLADTTAMRVRYVEIEVEDDVIERHSAGRYDAEDGHALIPIGLVRIDKDENEIYVEGLELHQIVDYPRYPRSRGYTTRYEIDTNDYLAGFHKHGSTYNRSLYSTEEHRNATSLNDAFYSSGFYTTPRG